MYKHFNSMSKLLNLIKIIFIQPTDIIKKNIKKNMLHVITCVKLRDYNKNFCRN